MKINSLTPEEERVIVNKGTEAPHSGGYDKFFADGLYVCRRCEALLYRSSDKFDSGCGWPAFDDEVLGAVRRLPDADGRRTEIACARCDAHLGHVFVGETLSVSNSHAKRGEELTPKNVRACVNSVSMKFIPEQEVGETTEAAYLGGGCFWCLEASFKLVKGVKSAVSGYAGGTVSDPTYGQVCGGQTGHAEVVKIDFDRTSISFEGILEVFFALHDPTTPNRQGNDIGPQYRSIILYASDLQKEIAQNFVKHLDAEKIFSVPIVTEIEPFENFYPAEENHQNYYERNAAAPYCRIVIAPKMAKIRNNLKKYLR
jgi:peptide methionine sulfoxide reductase msrA/msrB